MKNELLIILSTVWLSCTPAPQFRGQEAPESAPKAQVRAAPASSPAVDPVPKSADPSSKSGRPAEIKPSGAYAYTQVDSASMGDEITLVPERLVQENKGLEGDSATEKTVLPSARDSSALRIMDGYRIQVYATTNYLEAERKKEDLASAVADKIYAIYEAPYYKIRVGNFATEEEAKKLSKTLKDLSYDVYIVKSKIRTKK